MIKLFISTPAYSGKVNASYSIALAETVAHLAAKGISCQMFIPTSGSLLCAERNRILKKFLESDCTHILCIDGDLAWPSVAVEAMLKHNVDMVGGCYPARLDNTFLFRPCKEANGSLSTNGISLMKMEYIPAGFLLMRRCVIEKMQEVHKDRYFKSKQGPPEEGYALFNTEIYEGEFWGEDYVFCRLVREAGFDIWVDPMIQFNHEGRIGMLAQCLTNNPPEKTQEIGSEKDLQPSCSSLICSD